MRSKVIKRLSFLKSLIFFSDLENNIYKKMPRIPNRKIAAKKPVICVECIDDCFYIVMWYLLFDVLSQESDFLVQYIPVLYSFPGESTSFKKWVFTKISLNWLTERKLVKLYRQFSHKLAYRQTDFFAVFFHPLEFFTAFKSWRTLQTKEDLLALVFDDISVGDLIYDFYLRFKPSPTVQLDDFYLFIIIWRAKMYVRMSTKYFKKTKPVFYLTSYTTYISHGIPVRVALRLDVPVFSLGSFSEFFKKVTAESWYHTKDTSQYKSIFYQFEAIPNKLQAAETALQKRLSGAVDLATSYMKQSAYAGHDAEVPPLLGKIVIFLHDFFDSPHIYGSLLFPDFWEWICKTIEILQKNNIPFVIKPHPNQPLETLGDILEKLKNIYPSIEFISGKFSNTQLVGAGMSAAVSVYGTVAHEMAYLGVPTITSGENPHGSYEFDYRAKSLSEYEDLLIHHAGLATDKSKMREEALSFYYMHNLYPHHLSDLRAQIIALRKFIDAHSSGPFDSKKSVELGTNMESLKMGFSRPELIQMFNHLIK